MGPKTSSSSFPPGTRTSPGNDTDALFCELVMAAGWLGSHTFDYPNNEPSAQTAKRAAFEQPSGSMRRLFPFKKGGRTGDRTTARVSHPTSADEAVTVSVETEPREVSSETVRRPRRRGWSGKPSRPVAAWMPRPSGIRAAAGIFSTRLRLAHGASKGSRILLASVVGSVPNKFTESW